MQPANSVLEIIEEERGEEPGRIKRDRKNRTWKSIKEQTRFARGGSKRTA